MPGMEHFGHFYSDQPTPYNNCSFEPRAVSLHIFQVLKAVKTAYAVQILPGPAKFIGFGTTGQHQFVVGHLLPTHKMEGFGIRIDLFYVSLFKVDPVLGPKPILVRFGILVAHMPHVDVHERGAREEMIGFGRNEGNAVIGIEFPDEPGGSDTADSISNDGNVHG